MGRSVSVNTSDVNGTVEVLMICKMRMAARVHPKKFLRLQRVTKRFVFFFKEHWKDKHDSTATGVGDRVTFQIACQPIDFKRTVYVLCNEKRTAIHEMGFGPLHLFRSSKLHRPLCQMLVDNFDLANCSIHIHGRTVSRMEPEIACLRSTFGQMETSLAILKSEGLNGIVSDAMKSLFSRVPNLFSLGKDEGLSHSQEYSVPEQLSKSVQAYDTANELGSITPAVVVSRMCIPECLHEQEKETVGLPHESKSAQEDGTMNKERADIFSINSELSDGDVMILKYLFSDVRKDEDRFSSFTQRTRGLGWRVNLLVIPKMKSFMSFIPLYQLMSSYMKQPTVIPLHHI